MVKGVLIDLDGTLLDSEAPILSAVVLEMFRNGYYPTEADISKLVGATDEEYCQYLKKVLGPQCPANKILHFANNQKIEVKEGALDFIEGLEKKAIPWAIVTNSTKEIALNKLMRANLAIPSVLVSLNDVNSPKPAPDLYLKAAELLKIDPKDCIGIEDSEVGLLALHAAKIRSVYIPDILAGNFVSWRTRDNIKSVLDLLEK